MGIGWARKGLFAGRNVRRYFTFKEGSRHAWRRVRLQSFPPVHDIAVVAAVGDICCCSTIVVPGSRLFLL